MTATVQAKGVGAGFGDRELFSGVDLVVAPGDVVGLVGPNGAGKSTLLQILGGRRQPDSGSVAVSPAARAAGLPGAGDRAARRASRCAPTSSGGPASRAAQVALDAAADALRRGGARVPTTSTPRRSSGGCALGGADLEARLGTVADDLGLTVDLDHPMTALSGGQAARVGLAALLLSRYDLYLLDEPTNDLDAAGLDLLEEFVDRSEARDRRRQPRPGVPQPHRDVRRRDRPEPAARHHLRRQLRLLPRGALDRPPPGPRGLRGVRRPARRARRARPDAAGVDGEGRAERAAQGDRQRQARQAPPRRDVGEAGGEGPADRQDDRAARRGRGAAQGVAAADDASRRAGRSGAVVAVAPARGR